MGKTASASRTASTISASVTMVPKCSRIGDFVEPDFAMADQVVRDPVA